jgi:hypothetical protein
MTEQPDLGGLQPQLVKKEPTPTTKIQDGLPCCPECGEPLTLITEFRDDHEDFEWNKETKEYEGQGWEAHGTTCICGNCAAELPNSQRDYFLENAHSRERLLDKQLEVYKGFTQKIFGTTNIAIITQTIENMNSVFQQVQEETAKHNHN